MRRRDRGLHGGLGLRGVLLGEEGVERARLAAVHGCLRGRRGPGHRRLRGAQDLLLPPRALPPDIELHDQRGVRRLRPVRGREFQRPGVSHQLVLVPRRRHRPRRHDPAHGEQQHPGAGRRGDAAPHDSARCPAGRAADSRSGGAPDARPCTTKDAGELTRAL